MLLALRIAYIIFMIYLVFRMVKNDGCCGHRNHSSQHNNCQNSQNKNRDSYSIIITEEEKRNAIDL